MARSDGPGGGDDDGGDDVVARGDWPMFGHDPRGTLHNDESGIRPRDVAMFKMLRRTPTPGAVSGTPAVVGETVYAGDTVGNVFALRARDGRVRWQTKIDGAAFTASATVLRGRVVIGDQANGFIYGLDAESGEVRWKILPNPLGRPGIWGSGTIVGRHVAIGVASNDEGADPPFRSRGSLVLLDPRDGRVIWQTFTISDADYANSASGASIWSSPVFDEESDTIYVGTGNNFTRPATGTSDAFDARDGAIRWVNQRLPNDVWTIKFPTGPDADFGDSPQLYRQPDGRKVVGDGQKNGFYHVLDARTGAVVTDPPIQFISGSTLGGLYTDSAEAGVVFAPGNDLTTTPPSCALIAIKGDGSGELWRFTTDGLEANGVAIGDGVVFFKPSFDPNLYAFDPATGAKLAAIPVGGSNSGPALAHGRIFLGTGNILAGFNFHIPGEVVAIGR
jgi:polyvinyl alcohol dehydrogenase (cytochrome)